MRTPKRQKIQVHTKLYLRWILTLIIWYYLKDVDYIMYVAVIYCLMLLHQHPFDLIKQRYKVTMENMQLIRFLMLRLIIGQGGEVITYNY
jgi:hypothetical protein